MLITDAVSSKAIFFESPQFSTIIFRQINYFPPSEILLSSIGKEYRPKKMYVHSVAVYNFLFGNCFSNNSKLMSFQCKFFKATFYVRPFALRPQFSIPFKFNIGRFCLSFEVCLYLFLNYVCCAITTKWD